MRMIKLLEQITGNGTGTGTISVQALGPYDLYGILIRKVSGAATLAQLTFKVKINGTVRKTYTGAQLNAELVQMRATPYDSVTNPSLYIPFEMLGTKSAKQRDACLVRVGGNGANTVEIVIVTNGATTPVFEVRQLCRSIVAGSPRPLLMSVTPVQISVDNSGIYKQVLPNLEYGSETSTYLHKLMVVKGGGNLLALQFKLNSFEIFDANVVDQNTLAFLGQTYTLGGYFTQSFISDLDGHPGMLDMTGYHSGDQKFVVRAISDTTEVLDALAYQVGNSYTA